MFEQFPYTDIHQLNLDWIIKIAKDFLDQYTHIQELIDNGIIQIDEEATAKIQALDDKATALEAALDAWYNQHSQDIADALAAALADFATESQQLAEQAAESIPQDYSALSTLVNQINRSTMAIYIVQSNPLRNLIYNTSTKVLTFPADSTVLYGNRKAFGAPNSLDLASALAQYYAVCLWALDNDTIVVTGYTQQPQANNPHLFGYVYRDTVFINGVQPSNIQLTDGTNSYMLSEKPVEGSYVTIHSGVYDKHDFGQTSGTVIYDRDNKSLYFGSDAFFIYRGKAVGNRPYTVDMSSISGGGFFAFKLFLRPAGTVYAVSWNSGSFNPADDCIGYGYNDAIWIEGVPQYAIEKKQLDKNIYCFGDSIMEGWGASVENFSMLFHKWNRNIHCFNWAVGGSGYAVSKSGGTTCGGVEYKPTQEEMISAPSNNTALGMMSYVDSAMDYIMIMTGTNDYGSAIAESTFRSAVQQTLDYALSKTASVLVISPVRRNYNGVNGETVNAAGLKLSDYANIIKTECESRGIVFVDGYDIALVPTNATNKAAFYTDGLHLNDNGQARIANHALAKLYEMVNMRNRE